MNAELNRRNLLKTGAAASLAAMSQPFVGIPALAAYAAGPAVRRNAFTMAENDPILVGYRKAITAMRALPDVNPCSWFYQAAIHGTTDPRGLTAWNTCHTNAKYFWSWHRMYLYWFERIVRKYSGMYDWAIPYWDWANPAQRQLPPAFRVPTSVLYDATRNPAMNDGTGSASTALATSVANANLLLDFYSAQTGINGPHGSIHASVVLGNMTSVSTAAQDPIFWLHHSNVDRQWNLWLAQGGGRNDPLSDADWRNTTFTFFDECCQQVTMKACEVLRAALQLSYVYQEEPAQVNQYCPLIWNPKIFDIVAIARNPKPFILSRQPVSIPLSDAADKSLGKRLSEIARAPAQNALLQIKGIEAETQPGVSWEVYVGPPGMKPSPDSPYFVGIVALFSAGLKTRRTHDHPAEFAFAIDKAIVAARDASNLQVMFVPASGVVVKGRAQPAEVRADVTVGEISVVVDVAGPQPPKEDQEKLRRQEERP